MSIAFTLRSSAWIFIRDPDFATKATHVLDLCQRLWNGRPLAGNEYVISADEKTSVQARVFGRCSPKTGIIPFMDLAEQVVTQEPYASARRVFWVVDNGSSHCGKAAADRLTARFPHAVMVHTPVHASWLNQVEIFFSIVRRRVVTPHDFTGLQMEVHPGRP
ncbi:hypothetical protein [Nonomuraea sp. NPDC050783]|uniref:transposase n=1 Tax=Nonomuraea sp. NPDC050783 TaxID=3154634 RepID=UPI003465BE29